tara:strand:+ start:189 stop:881 length:693 start_codon:yes stop_codon:yes gene_type:complete
MKDILYVPTDIKRSKRLLRGLTLQLNILKRGAAFPLMDRKCTVEDLTQFMNSLTLLKDYISFTEVTELFSRDWVKAIHYETLSYNEALGLLLGIVPDSASLISQKDLSIKPDKECSFDYSIYLTPENDFLSRKYFDGKRINTQEFLEWATSVELMKAIIAPEQSAKVRESTTKVQGIINNIAKEIMNKHPRTPRYLLADEICDTLKNDYQISLSSDTIRTKKLKKYPNFS